MNFGIWQPNAEDNKGFNLNDQKCKYIWTCLNSLFGCECEPLTTKIIITIIIIIIKWKQWFSLYLVLVDGGARWCSG